MEILLCEDGVFFMDRKRIQKWIAVSLLLGCAVSLLWGMCALHQQQALAQQVIRLHVIAASDQAEDQALKLRVRDRVLAETSEWLEEGSDRDEAEATLRAHLGALRAAAQETAAQAGCTADVRAELSPEIYPTRDYWTFSLPGGTYLSLRVIIGEGAGHNWWCVVFPPLCTASETGTLEESAEKAGLSEENLALITQSDEEYVLKFKSVELWEAWTASLRK